MKKRVLSVLCLLWLTLMPLAAQDSADPWPKTQTVAGTTYSLYQPQIDKWDGFNYSGHAALAVQASGAQQPTYGSIVFTATTEVNKEARTVHFANVKITKVTFPGVAAAQAAAYQTAFQSALSGKEGDIPLDRLETQLAISKARDSQRGVKVLNPVPRFIFTQQPAILVTVQGQPSWGPVQGSTTKRLINTRALVLQDSSGTVYVHVLDGWMQAPALSGPWTVSYNPPPDADSIANALSQKNLVDLFQAPPNTANAPTLKTTAPQIYVATGPTELIVFQGPPEWASAGTNLQYVSNTTGNVFKSLIDQNYYVLVTGRWFRASDLNGPWAFVPARALPADFAAIPADGDKENVLASVPGTSQAQEAMIANTIPHTAQVKSGVAFQAQIDGTPTLIPIGGTNLSYVVNSPVPIIEVPGQGFYACQNGVWFTAKQLTGPWTVALVVPAAIYGIPSDSPLHYVTYVKVYQTTPTVVMGYTPGYMGAYVDQDGVVVYGTGYAYTPYVSEYAYYPVPDTYGYGAEMAWTPGTGWAFGMGFGWGVAYADHWGWGWGCPPYWGAWGPYYYGYNGHTAWGPNGWASTTGNVYSRWGNSYVTTRDSAGFNAWTGNSWTSHYASSYNSVTGRESAGQRATVDNVYTGNSATGARGATYNPNTGRTTTAAGAQINTAAGTTDVGKASTYNSRTGNYTGAVDVNNNVYADHNGNVYKNTGDGWEKYNGSSSGWSDVTHNADNNMLNSQAQARSWGNQRTEAWGNAGGLGDNSGAWSRGGFDRGSWGGGFNRGGFSGGMGGFRGGRR